MINRPRKYWKKIGQKSEQKIRPKKYWTKSQTKNRTPKLNKKSGKKIGLNILQEIGQIMNKKSYEKI